jgi:hypothetical protein
MPSLHRFDHFRAAQRPGMSSYRPGAAARSAWLERWCSASADVAAGVRMRGVRVPGADRCGLTAMHAGVRARSLFVTAELRAADRRGAFDRERWHHGRAVKRRGHRGHFKAALVQAAFPGARARRRLALAAAFRPAVIAGGVRGLAPVHPRLPHTAGTSIPVASIETRIDSGEGLTHRAGGPADASVADLATTAVSDADDGGTVLLGLVAAEHGLTRLRGLPTQARAETLIAITAPQQRAGPAGAWHTLKSLR